MRDASPQLIKALLPLLKTAVGYDRVYDKLPKRLEYPYVQISDIYQQEEGNKQHFQYSYDVLINVVYKNATSSLDRMTDQSNILSLATNAQGFALEDNFDLMKISLISNSNSKDLKTDSGILDIGLVRLDFLIKDNA